MAAARFAIVLAVLVILPIPHTAATSTRSIQATVEVNPLVVNLSVSPSEAAVGQPVQARAVVTNLGDAAVDHIVVTLRADTNAIVNRSPDSQVVPRLRAGRSVSVTWAICATRPGSYVVLAQVMAEDVVLDSPARLLLIASSGDRPCAGRPKAR